LIILHQPPGDINNGPLDKMESSYDSLGIKGDEIENFQNCLLVSLFLLMKYGCHVRVGIELLCK